MASSKPSESELVIFHFIRNHYEQKYKQNVPMALKYITIKFSKSIIGSKLLTSKQDLDFFKLLSTKLPSIRRFNLLFRASKHGYGGKKFHEHCDNKGGTITIIKSNFGNIFGGYTSKSWTSSGEAVGDENAFLFLIKSDDESVQKECPLLLELRKDYVKYESDIYCVANWGPVFGTGHDISISNDCNKKLGKIPEHNGHHNYSHLYSYECDKVVSLCGGDFTCKNTYGTYFFQVIDYEVFQIIQ